MPLAFHPGYDSLPYGNVMPGFAHVEIRGSVGWADPADGAAFAPVRNRLLTQARSAPATRSGQRLRSRARSWADAGAWTTNLPAASRLSCSPGRGQRLLSTRWPRIDSTSNQSGPRMVCCHSGQAARMAALTPSDGVPKLDHAVGVIAHRIALLGVFYAGRN